MKFLKEVRKVNYQSEQTEYFEKLIEPEILTKLPRYDTFCELLEMCKMIMPISLP